MFGGKSASVGDYFEQRINPHLCQCSDMHFIPSGALRLKERTERRQALKESLDAEDPVNLLIFSLSSRLDPTQPRLPVNPTPKRVWPTALCKVH